MNRIAQEQKIKFRNIYITDLIKLPTNQNEIGIEKIKKLANQFIQEFKEEMKKYEKGFDRYNIQGAIKEYNESLSMLTKEDIKKIYTIPQSKELEI